MRLRMCFVTVVTTLALASSADAAFLGINESGLLTGATGVLVGDTLYDVAFAEGTCAALFTGCDATSDFTFTSYADAINAGGALMDLVFLDGSAGNFDTQPNLTLGCISSPCLAMTPYDLPDSGVVQSAGWVNTSTLADLQTVRTRASSTLFNSAGNPNIVWAVWTPSIVTPVPEPATLSLVALGLVGMGAQRWRQRKT